MLQIIISLYSYASSEEAVEKRIWHLFWILFMEERINYMFVIIGVNMKFLGLIDRIRVSAEAVKHCRECRLTVPREHQFNCDTCEGRYKDEASFNFRLKKRSTNECFE